MKRINIDPHKYNNPEDAELGADAQLASDKKAVKELIEEIERNFTVKYKGDYRRTVECWQAFKKKVFKLESDSKVERDMKEVM